MTEMDTLKLIDSQLYNFMDSKLYSIMDITIMFILFESIILLAFVVSAIQEQKTHRIWLAWLIAAFAIDAAATLAYWTFPINGLFGKWITPLYLLLRLGLIIQAPLLLMYLRSLLGLSNDIRKDLKLFVVFPLSIGIALTVITLASLGLKGFENAADSYAVIWLEPAHKVYLAWQMTCMVVFSVMCWQTYQQFTSKMKEQLSSIDDLDEDWVRLLVIGFMLMCMCYIFAYIVSALGSAMRADHWFNTIGHYLDLIFINVLIFYSLRYIPRKRITDHSATPALSAVTPDNVLSYLKTNKPYLDPNYTLQQLAEGLGMNPKQLSRIINKKMHANFFELINNLRVEQAKQLLTNEPSLAIVDVMFQSGFQTKSAFNRVFKQTANVTPSQYRAARS